MNKYIIKLFREFKITDIINLGGLIQKWTELNKIGIESEYMIQKRIGYNLVCSKRMAFAEKKKRLDDF